VVKGAEMIEIPEEGLKIWICRYKNTFQELAEYGSGRETCRWFHPNEVCMHEDKNRIHKKCDAPAYRIVREKP
jgi:hypothetical protein